jgi:hypothetical protein
MASCYHCGRAGADFRRNVVTGRSQSTYYGKQSTTYSTRTNTGLRTVCEDCAFAIDKARLVQRIIGLWLVTIVLAGLIIYYKF